MKLLEFVSSQDNLTYTLFYDKNRYELNEEEIKQILTEEQLSELQSLKELTLTDWSKPAAIMPIIKRTSAARKQIAGNEKILSKLIGISGKANSPIINFKTKSTDKRKIYRTKIQLMDLNKWREGKYLYNMSTSEFKEILGVCDIKFSCECEFFHWGGLAYMATELDSAIYPVDIPNPVWRTRTGYSEPSLCKHLKGVLRLVKPNSSRILRALKDRFSSQARVSKNTN